jgi:predicted TIM-barrel fold metal-dependent hydrolase
VIIDGYDNTWERETQTLQAMDVAGVDMAVAVMEAILAAEPTLNLHLETSSAQLLDVRTTSRRLGLEKIIMGTDWPRSDFDLEHMKIARAIPDPEHRQRVEGENLAALPSLEPGRMTSADRRDLA